jgi:glucose/arabinose dehydrogenase
VHGVLAVATAVCAAIALTSAGSPADADRAGYRLRPLFRTAPAVHVAAPRSEPAKLYVVEQDGRVRVAVAGRLRRTPFLDIRDLVVSGGEMGLLSIAFHPSYARNRRFFVFYTDLFGDSRLAEYRANRAGTAALRKSARRLLAVRGASSEHKGGQLAFGPDGRLYVSIGDGRCCEDPDDVAQDLASRRGKLLRLDVARRTPSVELVGYGLRNPWRFSFDRETGDLYVADVGAGAWEEIDYVPRDEVGTLRNFGWDVYEGPLRIDTKQPNAQGQLAFPIHAYGHDVGCSITGGFVYRGSLVPEARGRYFYGDYCSGTIWSLRVVDGRATDVRTESFTVPSLSSFGEDARGELYAVSLDGRIYRLEP